LATTSLDNKIKLWDLSTAAPTLVTTKNAQVKSLFTLSYYRDSPFLLAAGGAAGTFFYFLCLPLFDSNFSIALALTGKVVMWDTLEDPAVRSKYGPTYSTPAAIDVYVKAEADESAKAAAEATNPSTKKGNKKYPKTKKPESDDDD
jgi:periodic tryptophan protein 1